MARSKRDGLAWKFARRVRRLREESGATQEDFAHRAGLSRSYYGEIERGGQNVCLETVEVIARGLGVEPRALFDFD